MGRKRLAVILRRSSQSFTPAGNSEALPWEKIPEAGPTDLKHPQATMVLRASATTSSAPTWVTWASTLRVSRLGSTNRTLALCGPGQEPAPAPVVRQGHPQNEATKLN